MAEQMVEITGGGPWGIRLYGGGTDPLVVARLRKRCRAMEAGLMEGDTLGSINGQSCGGMSHGAAMSLMEGAGATLRLGVRRGGNVAVPAAQPMQTAAPNANQFPSPSSSYHTASPGPYDGERRRESFTIEDADHRRHVITETSQNKFGDTTVTKVTREIEVLPQQRGAPSPSRMFEPSPQGTFVPSAPTNQTSAYIPASTAPPPRTQAVRPQPLVPQFQVSNFANKGPAKPGIWSPQAGAITVQAPTGVQVEHNPDQSVTMTLGFGGGGGGGGGGGFESAKENLPPSKSLPPKFTVKKVTNVQAAPTQTWQPGGARPPAPFKARTPSPVAPVREPSPMQTKWQPSFQPAPIQRPPPRPMTPPEPEPSRVTSEMAFIFPDEPDMRMKKLPLDVAKLMFHADYSSDEGSIDSPSGIRRRNDEHAVPATKREKIYADSAFYDDPEHKYPTIEEQIKMARKVAVSLMAPANKRTRGHTMFMKRREKADKWVAGDRGGMFEYISGGSDEDEKYYNPDPWSARADDHPAPWMPHPSEEHHPTPWQPTPPGQTYIPPPPPRPFTPEFRIKKPERPANIWAAPNVPDVDEEKSHVLSHDEFEKMRLYEQKTLHNTIAPQVAFSLADDLRNMKGRGGQLFAKRRQKAEQWVVDPMGAGTGGGPDPVVMQRLAMQAGMQGAVVAPPKPPPSEQSDEGSATSGPVTNRLAGMIATKGPMTPWEAASQNTQGRTDAAFTHLGFGNKVSQAAELASMRKTYEWSHEEPIPGGTKTTSMSMSSSQFAPQSSSSQQPNYNKRVRGWYGTGETTTISSEPSGGFRAVKFTPPIGAGGNTANQGIFRSPIEVGAGSSDL